jgi:hypothetical protein
MMYPRTYTTCTYVSGLQLRAKNIKRHVSKDEHEKLCSFVAELERAICPVRQGKTKQKLTWSESMVM